MVAKQSAETRDEVKRSPSKPAPTAATGLTHALTAVTFAPSTSFIPYACTANSNWNNDTSGPSRYVVWLLPLLAFVAAEETGGPASRPPGRLRGE